MSGSVIKRLSINTKLKQYRHLHKRCISTTSSKQHIKDNILYNPKTLEIPNISLPEYIYTQIDRFADYTAFECPQTRKKYTFADVRKYSRNFSKALRKKFQLNNGDVALIFLQNCPEFPIAALGCLEAGVVASTTNSLYTPDEVARQLQDCGAKIVITSYELYETAVKAVAKLPNKLPIICLKTKQDQSLPQGSVDFFELINNPIDIPDLQLPNPDDLAILPYSSGTTGLPKGVKLSHRNIVSNLVQMSDPDIDIVQETHGNCQDVTPGVLPMFHIYGFTITTLNVMSRGAKVLTLPRFHPDTFIDVLKNYPISCIFSAPPLVLFMSLHPDVKPEYFKSLRKVMSGAAPLGALDEQRFREKAGSHVFISQGYGLTETSPVITGTSPMIKEKFGDKTAGSIGQVVGNTLVKLVTPGNSSGVPLKAYEKGELLVKGPQVMQGYHNRPDATKDAFVDGWLKTGDLAYYDENGLLFITDRVKELIKVRGFQVAPAELEELLRDHPKVTDAAVIGIPHEVNGEVPRAYIQTKGDVNSEELYKFVSEKVAKYKNLEGGIEFVKEIPKNSAGKILRRQLKEKYLSEQNA